MGLLLGWLVGLLGWFDDGLIAGLTDGRLRGWLTVGLCHGRLGVGHGVGLRAKLIARLAVGLAALLIAGIAVG